MKAKKVMCMLLAAVLAGSMMAGCQGEGSGESKQSADSGKNDFQIVTVRWTDTWPIDYLHEGIMKEMEDKGDVKIDWKVYYDTDWQEQKSLLLASGELPDAFWGNICLKDTDIAQNKSYFLELSDLIDQNMPNLKKVLEKEPELKARITDRDGKIYSLPKKAPLRPKVDGNCMYINKKWLQNLNLEMPKTYQELEEVLYKFVTEDADGDSDKGNEIGITGNAGQYVASNTMRDLMAPFAAIVSRDNNYMGLDAEGKPVFMPAQENYKEGIMWLNELYQKGILDPEFFTQEASMATSKIQSAKVGLITGWTADAVAGPVADQYEVVPALEGPDGGHYVEYAPSFLDVSDRELVLTKDCENPEKLLQYADQFYDDEVSLQTYYGSIPDQIKKNDDGTYEVLVPTDGSSLDTSAWSNSMRDFGPKYMNEDFYSKVILPQDQGDGIKLAEDKVNEQYVKTDRNIGLPMLKYTEDELTQLTTIGTDIYKYVEAQFAHWVVDGGIENEWDAYLKQLDTMGLQDLVKIHDTAFQAYQDANKG